MPSTYTQNLGLEKPATGEQAGVWGTTANTSYDGIDTATDGNLKIALSASAYNLNTANGAPSQGRNKVVAWSGALTQNATVNITPNTAQKLYLMTNNTTGGFSIVFKQGSGGAFTLQPGYSAWLYADGAGNTALVDAALKNPQFGNVLVTGNLTLNGSLVSTAAQVFSQPVTFNAAVALNGPTTATGLVINTTGYAAAPYDIYYRSGAGTVVPLPVGSPAQVLQVQSNGSIAWATVQLSIGSVVAGATPYAVYYSSGANLLAQSALVNINPAAGLGIGLVPSHSLHLGYGATPEVWLDTNAPATGTQQRQLLYATNGVPRWHLYSPAQAEGGGNTGSNLNLICYNDAGNATIQVLSGWRASGNLSVGVYGDMGASLGVTAHGATQPPIIARGVAGQQYLQIWQDVNGTTMASIDGAGTLYLAHSTFLQVQPVSGRLNLYGTIPNSPWGCIHVGREPNTTTQVAGIRGAIAMEVAGSETDVLPSGLIRFYYRGGAFVINYVEGGQQRYAYLMLAGAPLGPIQWNVTTTVFF